MFGSDVVTALVGGLFIGVLFGFFIGERVVLRHLYDLWPNARGDILKAGYRDPARPWWKISRTYWVVFGAIGLMIYLANATDTPGAAAGANEPPPLEYGPWQLDFDGPDH